MALGKREDENQYLSKEYKEAINEFQSRMDVDDDLVIGRLPDGTRIFKSTAKPAQRFFKDTASGKIFDITLNGVSLSRSEIARRTGLEMSYISKIFSGVRMPSLINARKICVAFGYRDAEGGRTIVSMDDLYDVLLVVTDKPLMGGRSQYRYDDPNVVKTYGNGVLRHKRPRKDKVRLPGPEANDQ